MNAPKTLRELSCADDYDPNSMPVDKARALIRQFLEPVTSVERVHIRAGARSRARRGRRSRRSTCRVTTTRRWTVGRCASPTSPPTGETTLKRIGESFAGKPYDGAIGPGETVRIFTGGVMPGGADTVVMQERAAETDGRVTIAAGAVAKAGTNRRFAGEDLKRGAVVFRRGQPLRPAELGMLASLGINEIGVYRKLRVAFFSTGDELRSDRPAARRRTALRQQSLHALRHADATQLRHRRHGRGAGRFPRRSSARSPPRPRAPTS